MLPPRRSSTTAPGNLALGSRIPSLSQRSFASSPFTFTIEKLFALFFLGGCSDASKRSATTTVFIEIRHSTKLSEEGKCVYRDLEVALRDQLQVPDDAAGRPLVHLVWIAGCRA